MESINFSNGSLQAFAENHVPSNYWEWAWKNYKNVVLDLIKCFGSQKVLEIGGGRSPLYSYEMARSLGIDFAINDISQSELDRTTEPLHKVCFDISGPCIPSGELGQYDLILSKMVMEHVRDAEQTYRNIFALLRQGGIVLNYHPVLYALPFVINKLLPDTTTRWVLQALDRSRNSDMTPKFPAFYSYCKISAKTEAMIKNVGFSEVVLLPFYGHGYLRSIPGLRHIDDFISRWASENDKTRLAAYCYALARK